VLFGLKQNVSSKVLLAKTNYALFPLIEPSTSYFNTHSSTLQIAVLLVIDHLKTPTRLICFGHSFGEANYSLYIF